MDDNKVEIFKVINTTASRGAQSEAGVEKIQGNKNIKMCQWKTQIQ